MGQNLTGLKQKHRKERVGELEEGCLYHHLTVLPAYQQHPRRWPTHQNKTYTDAKMDVQSHLTEPHQKYPVFENTIVNNNNSIGYSLSKYQKHSSDLRFGSSQSQHKGPAWLYSYPKPLSLLSPYPSLEFHYLDPQTLPLQPVPVSLEVSDDPMRVLCPNCSNCVLAVPKRRMGLLATVNSDFLCNICRWLFAFLPFCKVNIWYECPNCSHVIATNHKHQHL